MLVSRLWIRGVAVRHSLLQQDGTFVGGAMLGEMRFLNVMLDRNLWAQLATLTKEHPSDTSPAE